MTKNQLPNTDFFTLLKASNISNVPIELCKDIVVDDFKSNDENMFELFQSNEKITSVKFIPNKKRKSFNYNTLCRLDINKTMRELNIVFLSNQTLKYNEFPFGVILNLDEKGVMTFNFNYLTSNISEVLKLYDIIKFWNENGLRRLKLTRGSDLKEILNVVPPSGISTKKNLSLFYTKLKKILEFLKSEIDDNPQFFKKDIIEEVRNFDLKLLSKDSASEIFNKIKKSISKSYTKLFLSIKDAKENVISIKYLGVVNYLLDIKKLKLNFYKKNDGDDILKRIISGSEEFNIGKYHFATVKEAYDNIIDIFDLRRNNPIERVINYVHKDKIEINTGCIISVKFSKICINSWEQREQKIEINIIKDEEKVKKYNMIRKYFDEKDFVNALPIMEELNRERFSESIAYAYCIKGEYEKSIELCNQVIEKNYISVVHFTKGLSLINLGRFEEAVNSYINGIICVKNEIWYPTILDNLSNQIKEKNIENEYVNKIIEIIKRYSKIKKLKDKKRIRCFCKEKKSYGICHGKEFFENYLN